jgi:hypothetical protein
MALATLEMINTVDPCFLRTTDRCFFCGEPLSGHLWIYWNGNDEKGQQIWLHPWCAKRLADNLNKDFANHITGK